MSWRGLDGLWWARSAIPDMRVAWLGGCCTGIMEAFIRSLLFVLGDALSAGWRDEARHRYLCYTTTSALSACERSSSANCG